MHLVHQWVDFCETADVLYASAQSSGPPTLDNGLINGTNVYGDDDSDSQTGSRLELSVVNGTSYRMRLVNAAIGQCVDADADEDRTDSTQIHISSS